MKYLFITAFLFNSVYGYSQREIRPTNELTIKGEVKAPRIFTISDLKKIQQTDLGDISVKNHKGEEKYVAHKVRGVLIKSLLDSVEMSSNNPKELSEYIFIFVASDNYRNIYSWNEIFNTDIGNRLYIITEKDGKNISDTEERIQVVSMGDINMGLRRMRGLATVEVKKVIAE